MDISTLFQLYLKEREYQKQSFGEYKDLPVLNLASFILFLDQYIEKCKDKYYGKWETNLPSWIESSVEMEHGSAPVEVYKELIKVFALAGAALETFVNIVPSEWRRE